MAAAVASPPPIATQSSPFVVTSPPASNPRVTPPMRSSTTDATGSAGSSREASPGRPSPPVSPGGNTVVPAYPYSVAMSFIPGSTASLSGYFATHQGERMPDDSDVQTRLPSICVDYLSHDWAEDDVWTSWKAMTKHKAEIANGVRLENASWRTWAKQRSNLPTVSPETLNWLKDSDVTWLYGPLHTAVDPVPIRKEASTEERLGIDTRFRKPRTTTGVADEPASTAPTSRDSSGSSTGSKPSARPQRKPSKPILKYRSLSDILSVPPNLGMRSPMTDVSYASDSEGAPTPDDGVHHRYRSDPGIRATAHGGYFAAVPISASPANATPDESSSPQSQTSFDRAQVPPGSDSSMHSIDAAEPSRHRHISFNHRVEQCIAVDDEEGWRRRDGMPPTPPKRRSLGILVDDEDEEDDDDEEEVLSFRSSPRTQTTALAPRTPVSPYKEPHTIAKLAPTTLKSDEILPAPYPIIVYDAYERSETQTVDSVPLPAKAAPDAAPSYYARSGAPPSNAPPRSQWDKDDDDEFAALGFDYVGEGHAEDHANSNSSSSTASPVASAVTMAGHGPREPPPSSAQPSKSILKGRRPVPVDSSPSPTSSSGPSTPSPSASPPSIGGAGAFATVNPSPSSSTATLHASSGHSPLVEPGRGRSISRGSSSSSLDGRAASSDRRGSPSIGAVTIDAHRGRSTSARWSNSGSNDSLNSLPHSSAAPSLPVVPEASDATPRSSPSASRTVPLPSSPPARAPRKTISSSSLGDLADVPDDEVQRKLGFESPVMPSSPTLRAQTAWTDESAARRSLLKARASADAALAGHEKHRRGSNDSSSRGSTAAADDYGFAYGYDDEEMGVVGRAVEIAATARDLVGALLNVGVGMVWRRG